MPTQILNINLIIVKAMRKYNEGSISSDRELFSIDALNKNKIKSNSLLTIRKG